MRCVVTAQGGIAAALAEVKEEGWGRGRHNRPNSMSKAEESYIDIVSLILLFCFVH